MANSPLSVAIAKVLFSIPKPILNAAFTPESRRMSLDECIIEDIIRAKILPDVNANSGKFKRIPLSNTWIEQTDYVQAGTYGLGTHGGQVYRIPPDARENRNINTTIRITPNVMYSEGMLGQAIGITTPGSTITNMINGLVDSRTYSASHMPMVNYLGDNIILVKPHYSVEGLTLECTLMYDDEFTGLNQHAILPFSNLVTVATKSYIYTQLILAIGQNRLIAGQSLGEFQEIVREYKQEGSDEKYDELLNTLKGSMLMDPDTQRRIMAACI